MIQRVCTIEPWIFKTTSGMHRRPIAGRHLIIDVEFALMFPRSRILLTPKQQNEKKAVVMDHFYSFAISEHFYVW